jgi:hypothetical protein
MVAVLDSCVLYEIFTALWLGPIVWPFLPHQLLTIHVSWPKSGYQLLCITTWLTVIKIKFPSPIYNPPIAKYCKPCHQSGQMPHTQHEAPNNTLPTSYSLGSVRYYGSLCQLTLHATKQPASLAQWTITSSIAVRIWVYDGKTRFKANEKLS